MMMLQLNIILKKTIILALSCMVVFGLTATLCKLMGLDHYHAKLVAIISPNLYVANLVYYHSDL